MRHIGKAVGFALLLMLLFSVAVLAQSGAAGWSNFETNVRFQGDIRVDDDVIVVDDITADDITADDLTIGDLTMSGSLDALSLGNPSAATVVMNGNITPTASYWPLTAAGTVGTDLVLTTTLDAGTVLILYNAVNQTITISDSTNMKLSGNIALGQYDTLTLVHDGLFWVQLATANN